jgi:hypothetical protein
MQFKTFRLIFNVEINWMNTMQPEIGSDAWEERVSSTVRANTLGL